MLTMKRRKWICIVLAIVLSASTVGCSFSEVMGGGDEEKGTFSASDIPEIIIKEISVLPKNTDSARIIASPVGGNPIYYVFDDDLLYYRYDHWTDQYHECTLTLPEDITDGRIIHACAGGGSGELDMAVEAKHRNEPVFLNYFFYTGDSSEQMSPMSVTFLDKKQVRHLFEQITLSQEETGTDSNDN